MTEENELAARDKRAARKMERRLSHLHSNTKISTHNYPRQQGFTKVPNWLIRWPNLSPQARLLLFDLLSYAWGEGSCFPSQRTLSSDIGLSPRRIRHYLDELVRFGLIKIIKRRGRSNIYLLLICDDNDDLLDGKQFSREGRKTAAGTQVTDAPEEDISNKKAIRRKKNTQVNREVLEELQRSQVREPAASIIASKPGISPEYVQKFISFSRIHGESLALTVHKMKSGDPAPPICLECGWVDGRHHHDCNVPRLEYLGGEL